MDFVGVLSLIAIVFCSVGNSGAAATRRQALPVLTISLASLVAAGLLGQLVYPTLLALFGRNAGAIRSGEWYRVVTSLFVQDHWLIGGLFNVTMMVVVGRIAESRFGRLHWSLIYFGGGVLTELIALRWQPIGAGNSIAYMSLAGALLVSTLKDARSLRPRLSGVIGLMIAVALCCRYDIHGAAVLIGAAYAAVALGIRPTRSRA
ncbi:rhomboid family intramembrane serine protease [Glacieibacterium megasporae]|uniref:rhomboid family intramembrane serine protease n=1 Tax=Glacieibacterium megasporae TaxID=2835787 RepID=UPI001C1E876E|nr:rhomboid family intramembrane serine protease [Polymorphobacter megasporae]UAJ09749.1 rhomboid family intramembrane serine protease [Polymorphobacter megasporae]